MFAQACEEAIQTHHLTRSREVSDDDTIVGFTVGSPALGRHSLIVFAVAGETLRGRLFKKNLCASVQSTPRRVALSYSETVFMTADVNMGSRGVLLSRSNRTSVADANNEMPAKARPA